MLASAWHAFAKTSPEGHVLERPYHLGDLEKADDLDASTVAEAIQALKLDPLTETAFAAEISVQMNAHPRDVSYLSQLRWWSASGWDLSLMIDCLARYKIETGFTSLIQRMVDRSDLDIRLEKPVTRVDQTPDGIRVTAESGEVFRAKKVVCALPMNCLKDVAFDPPLGFREARLYRAKSMRRKA